MKFVFAFLLPLLLYSLSYFAPPGKIGKFHHLEKFDHFWFVLQWPPSFCEVNVKNCRPATPNFTIHGLWPTDEEGYTLNKTVQPISNLSFLLDNDESPLVRYLNQYWRTFQIDNINKCFWIHEWNKHGRTISKWNEQEPVEPKDYFDKAVYLFMNKLSNISSALNESGLVPNNSFYPVSDFTSAIANITGPGTVMLECKKKEKAVPDLLLREVRLCVDSNATNFIECSGENEQNKTQDSCHNGTIRFPGALIP